MLTSEWVIRYGVGPRHLYCMYFISMCVYFTYICVYAFYISTGDSDGQLGLRALPLGIQGWGPRQGARWAMWGEWTVWGQSASRKQEPGGRAWLMYDWVQVEGWQQVLMEGCDWGLGLWIPQRWGPQPLNTAGSQVPGSVYSAESQLIIIPLS